MTTETMPQDQPVPFKVRLACWFKDHDWKTGYGFTVFMGWGCRTKTCARCGRTYFRICVGSDGEESW